MLAAHRVVSAAALGLVLSVSLARAQEIRPREAPTEPEPLPAAVRLAGSAFGSAARIEVRGLSVEAGEAAGRRAFAALAAAEAEVAGSGPLAALAAQAGRPVSLAPQLLELLQRTVGFCEWSDGRVGPLGGGAYALWGLRQPVSALPDPEALKEAAATATCNRLSVNLTTRTATLAAGSRLELWGFEIGWAVDRAVAELRSGGVDNGWVEVGNVRRGFGAGPSGKGWPVFGLRFPGQSEPLAPIALVDKALAVATLSDRALSIAGDTYPPYLDLRTAKPARGTLAVLAASDLAVDAQGLAMAMFVAGTSQGQLLLGSLRPTPSVLWLLGTGVGEPLLEGSRWSALRPQ